MSVPQEAIDAACDALAETGSAVAALEAGAPHIAAAERERILNALPGLVGSSLARIVSDALGGQL